MTTNATLRMIAGSVTGISLAILFHSLVITGRRADADLPSAPLPHFSVMKLAIFPGGREGTALAINEAGQIVGRAGMADGTYRAALWENGKMISLGTLGGSFSEARSINSAGKIVGSSQAADGLCHAFLYSNGHMEDIGLLHGGIFSSANAINDQGDIVGLADTNNRNHAFLWRQRMYDMGPVPGYPGSVAMAINDQGMIVGSSTLAIDDGARAFVRDGTHIEHLGTLPGLTGSIARDINDEGIVVGSSGSSVRTSRPVLWKDGSMIDLGATSRYPHGVANGINRHGFVVGYYMGTAETRAAVWSGGKMCDLNLLLPKNSGWTLLTATAINDHDQIVGKGRYSGREIGFLLTPQLPGNK